MATLTRHPKEVLTERGDKPSPEKRAENADVRLIRGRSSATTTHDRIQARFTPFAWNGIENKRINDYNRTCTIVGQIYHTSLCNYAKCGTRMTS